MDDFSGQYTAASAGAGRAGISTMRNANGVVMNLKAITRGVKLTAASRACVAGEHR